MKDTEKAHPDTLLFDVYRKLNRGKAMAEASEALSRCVAAAEEHGKKAKLTLSITIVPLKDYDNSVEIVDDIKVDLPKAKRKPRILFTTAEGMLTTEQPDQDEFRFERDASVVATDPRAETLPEPDRKAAASGE